MIEHILAYGTDASVERELIDSLHAHTEYVLSTAHESDHAIVGRVEAEVASDPAGTISFDGRGKATLRAEGRTWAAGRFEIPRLWSLKTRAQRVTDDGRVRLFVLYGDGPATDIGALQAYAGPDTAFQVASQFNCLESPGPYVTPVARYYHDPTQGPRASFSAFPGTLLRHYAAPSTDGRRFTQENDGEQVNLLCDLEDVAPVRNGYLRAADIEDPGALWRELVDRADGVRVGVHDDVEVALGYNWDGVVDVPRTIMQVFTSTVAIGAGDPSPELLGACRELLRTAYLGTLLATRASGRHTAVLSLIGGGVFGNPIPLIWDSIVWACGEVSRWSPGALNVVVNGRNLATQMDPAELARDASAWGGVVVEIGRDGVKILR